MGSPPHSVQQLLHTLEWEPDLITWSAERRATLRKGPQGKLGFSVKTYKGKKYTYTVLLKVKVECDIRAGQLKRFDRITAINNIEITCNSEQHILNILATLNNSEILLTLCRPVKFKISNLKSRGVVKNKLSKGGVDEHKSSDSLLDISDTSISFNSWNSSGSGSLNLQNFSGLESDAGEPSPVLHETSFDTKLKPRESCKGFDCSCDNHTDERDGNLDINFERNSSDLSKTSAQIDNRDNTLKFKRAISQVSGCNSYRSQSSLNEEMRRREKSKTTKFVKTGSIENTDEEVEPLHTEEKISPRIVSKHRYSHFNVDDRSNTMPTTISVADIVVEDPTLSLPLSFNNTSMTQSHTSNCQCTTCIPGQDQRVCSMCVAQKSKPPSPAVVSLLAESQPVSLSEEHGHMILQNPQLAVWDGKNTHVVEIDKGQSKGFGFSYKVKVGKNQDASVETYTLVDKVDRDSPSRDKLRVGDWVRSVNGTPIQIPMNAFTLLKNGNKERSIRLVIQRPVRLSESQLVLERDRTVQDLNPPSPQSPAGGTGDQDPLIPGTIAPRKPDEKTVVPPNIYVIDSTNGVSSVNSTLPPFPKSVKLPKVRIFVCGNEAEKCSKLLLKDSGIDLKCQNQCYAFTSCSMATDCFGNILISQPCSNLYSTSTTSLRTSLINQSDHRGGGDSRCKQCGGEFQSSVVGQNAIQGNIVNVELFAVPDDRFFHYCCSYLFTQSSIFILTFDASKLLQSPASEFSRLQNLSHTIRSFSGEDSHIMSCGFIDGGTDSSCISDEVGALFYTPLNSVLQNFHVLGPELVSSNTPNSSSENSSIDNQLLQVLWKGVTETVQRQHDVLQPSLLLIDHLATLREKEFILTESQLMEIIRGKLPNYQLDVHQVILTCLIENREILLGKASSFINSKFHRQIESLILLDPQSLLSCLQQIITTVIEDKQNWLKTHSTGFVKMSSFLDLCQASDQNKQFIADFMECNGIIVKKANSPGSVNEAEYFFPYFSIPLSTADKPVVENREYELYLKFTDHQPSQIYYALLFTIGANCDVPSTFNVQDIQTCVFQQMGYHAVAYHQKIEDRIHFVFKREDKMGGAKPVELFTWLHDVCHMVLGSLYVSFILGAPCPRMENCSRINLTGIHVIDLSEKKPQFCDQERIDTMKPIRMWKQKDYQNQEQFVPSLVNRSNKTQKQLVSVFDLPHSVLHNVCSRLRIPSTVGRDWTGLAGLMGYTHEEVKIMETVKDPVRELLYDWSTTHNGKIDQLVKLLEELEMENVLTFLRQAMPQNPLNSLSPTATQNSMVSFQSLSQNSEYPECSVLSGQVIYQRSKVTETEVMPLNEESQGHMIRLNNLDGNNKIDNITGTTNQAITPVETTMDVNGILKS